MILEQINIGSLVEHTIAKIKFNADGLMMFDDFKRWIEHLAINKLEMQVRSKVRSKVRSNVLFNVLCRRAPMLPMTRSSGCSH